MNSRPLIEGLAERADVRMTFDVPARLAARLGAAEFDAALLPIFDVISGEFPFEIVSDACIGCDGETMTVRVFSQCPPHKVRTLWVDADSHTSVALARVLWRELYDITLEVRPLTTGVAEAHAHDAVLLIGDKVVDPRRGSFAYEVDLGGAWRQHTGLPFVFAVWAARRRNAGECAAESCGCGGPARGAGISRNALFDTLSDARERGVARAAEIAEESADRHGWPAGLARRYLTRCLQFKIDDRMAQGAELFASLCAANDIIASPVALKWPAQISRAGVCAATTPVDEA